jgi:NADP-dependent 3-hydroxy acid dehydrogenase YdfG
VVTGASGDLGRGIAIAVAAAGADVCLIARNVDKLEETRSRVEATGQRATVAPADVTDVGSIAAAASAIGTVDIVVNNAGGARFVAKLGDVKRSGWDKTIALNLTGPLLVAQAWLPGTIDRGGGAIVNVASLPGCRRWTR